MNKRNRCVLTLFILLGLGRIAQAQTYVQSKTAALGSSGNISATFTSQPAAGNTVVVGVVCYGPTGCTLTSVTDNFSNSYTQVGPIPYFGGPTNNITKVALYCTSGISTGATFAVTAALSNSGGGDSNLYIAEYSGLSCIVDQSASGSDTGSNATVMQTSSMTTTNASDLLFAVAASASGGAPTPGTGFVLRENSNNGIAEDGGLEDRVVTTTGSYSASMSLASATQYWAMSVVALKASTATTGPFRQAAQVDLPANSQLTYTCSFTQPNLAGNTLILAGRFHQASTWNVTDSLGNSWVPVVDNQIGLWYAPNSKAGTNTITVTYSVNQPFQGVCGEYSGLFAPDQFATVASGSGTTATSSSITTTTNGDLIIGFGTNDTANGAGGTRGDLSAGSGFTLRGNANIFVEDEVQSTVGPITSSANYGASVLWNQNIAAFSPMPAGSPIITSLTPLSGSIGTGVTIAGTNFGSSQGTSTVKFNGTSATSFPGWSSSSISTNVPSRATTGKVVVNVGGLNSNGLNFNVSGGGGAVSYVQSKTSALGSSGNISATFTSQPATGNTIVAGVVCYGPTGCTISSVTDNFSNTYTQVGPIPFYGGPTNNITKVALYCASGISSGANFAVTAALSNGSGGDSNFYIAEYSGASCNVDQSASGSLTGGTATTLMQTSSATTTNASDLLVAVAGATSGGAATAGAGYTLRQNGNSGVAEFGGFEDRIVAATGSYSGSMTLASSTQYWAMVMVALKATSGSGGGGPTITRLSPPSGPIGASVTIIGTNFGTTIASNTVTFSNGKNATVTSANSTTLIATVPSGAVTGPVVVTVGGQTSTGIPFTVTSALLPPNITSVSPLSSNPGTPITINGNGFGPSQGSGLIWLGSRLGIVTNWSDTQILATVAPGSGPGFVRVFQNGRWSNSVPIGGCF